MICKDCLIRQQSGLIKLFLCCNKTKKVDRLEESLSEANGYKLSSEKMQQYNDLMQQKLKLLDERLQKSDEEINYYVQSYQDSMKEFQDTLNNLKEESKKKAEDESVPDKPVEF
ncbi:hypothetical protein ACS0TY_025039 [Phlomoides rotata]